MALTKDQEISIARIQDTFAHFNNTIKEGSDPQFDSDLMRRARVIDATSAGAVIIELEVGNAYANRRGLMHGGAAALILDQFTTAAFIPLTSIEASRNEYYGSRSRLKAILKSLLQS